MTGTIASVLELLSRICQLNNILNLFSQNSHKLECLQSRLPLFFFFLESVQWNSVVIPDRHVAAVDQLWNAFKSSFVSVAVRHAPIIQRRVRGIDNCPWLNKEIKLVMRQRDYFHSKARKTNHSED